MIVQVRTSVVAAGIPSAAVGTEAQWSRCESALDELWLTSHATHEVTGDLSSVKETPRDYEKQYRSCLHDRELFQAGGQRLDPTPLVITSDGCRNTLMLRQATETRYETATQDARHAFDALALAVQAVERLCDYPLTARAPAERAPGR
jgi:hypothetical protein